MEGATVHQGEVYVNLLLRTVVARAGAEFAVYCIKNSPKDEAKIFI